MSKRRGPVPERWTGLTETTPELTRASRPDFHVFPCPLHPSRGWVSGSEIYTHRNSGPPLSSTVYGVTFVDRSSGLLPRENSPVADRSLIPSVVPRTSGSQGVARVRVPLLGEEEGREDTGVVTTGQGVRSFYTLGWVVLCVCREPGTRPGFGEGTGTSERFRDRGGVRGRPTVRWSSGVLWVQLNGGGASGFRNFKLSESLRHCGLPRKYLSCPYYNTSHNRRISPDECHPPGGGRGGCVKSPEVPRGGGIPGSGSRHRGDGHCSNNVLSGDVCPRTTLRPWGDRNRPNLVSSTSPPARSPL